MLKNFENYIQSVQFDEGYFIDQLINKDLEIFRSVVEKHYRSILKENGINKIEILNKPINEYHEICNLIDHSSVWTKKSRILNEKEIEILFQTIFFKKLQDELGYLLITDEDKSGYPELYFRLVRPSPHSDIGPLHADKWFWDISDNKIPAGYKRIKFWFSLWNNNKNSGFRYVPNSHKNNYNHKYEIKHNKKKPYFNEQDYDLQIKTLDCTPGGFIVFNDELIHGGYVCELNTRVSIEFTLLIKSNDYPLKII